MTKKRNQAQSLNGNQVSDQPDPEVVPQARRRNFSAAYKLGILKEADQCEQTGQIGALLRREGLYSSHLTTWRRQRKAGQLAGLKARKRGPKKDERAAELMALRRENERLKARLEQADLIITAQKKLSQALERTLRADKDERS